MPGCLSPRNGGRTSAHHRSALRHITGTNRERPEGTKNTSCETAGLKPEESTVTQEVPCDAPLSTWHCHCSIPGSLLWCRFSPQPRNFHMLQGVAKKYNQKKRGGGIPTTPWDHNASPGRGRRKISVSHPHSSPGPANPTPTAPTTREGTSRVRQGSSKAAATKRGTRFKHLRENWHNVLGFLQNHLRRGKCLRAEMK